MGYLLHLNVKHAKIFGQEKLIVLLVSIFIFSLIYYHLGDRHYNVKSTHKLYYFDGLYLSVVTQSLLGPGDITPRTNIARFFLLLQVSVTLFITFVYINE